MCLKNVLREESFLPAVNLRHFPAVGLSCHLHLRYLFLSQVLGTLNFSWSPSLALAEEEAVEEDTSLTLTLMAGIVHLPVGNSLLTWTAGCTRTLGPKTNPLRGEITVISKTSREAVEELVPVMGARALMEVGAQLNKDTILRLGATAANLSRTHSSKAVEAMGLTVPVRASLLRNSQAEAGISKSAVILSN